jgi:transposase
VNVTGGITRAGNEMVRKALYEAANVLLSRIMLFSRLKRWGRTSPSDEVQSGRRCKIGVILHRMWVDGTTYRWTKVKPIAAQA